MSTETKVLTGVAQLKRNRSSARKMRLVADLIRGKEVKHALSILNYTSKKAATPLYKLLKSAVANLQDKHQEVDLDEASLVVKTLYVNQSKFAKRTRPAPQGRAMLIRKKYNHVYLSVEATYETPIEEKVEPAEVTSSEDKSE